MSSGGSSSQPGRRPHPRDALEPIATDSTSTSAHVEAVSRAIFAPFQRKKEDSTNILTGLAPVLMTPKLVHAASSSKPRSSLGSSHRMDLAALGRAPFRFSMGTRRISSMDLQVAEAAEELLSQEVPDVDPPSGVSLLRGFNATIPSSEKGKQRRRQMRNVETPRIGLKKLGMNARGLLTEDDGSGSDEDMVVIGRETKSQLKGKRRARESLGASVALGKDELRRQKKEILLDKENIHVRRALINSEIAEVSHKIQSLETVRMRLEEDLLKLKEEELELDDELEGVKERMEFEESLKSSRRESSQGPHQSSRRRKGPTFLPSEHDELPPGVAFITLSSHRSPISSLDFSEPYGTLVSASSGATDDDDTAPIVWDLLTVEELGRLRGHVGAVKCLQVEEHVCLTGGEDGGVRVWDLRRVGLEGAREKGRDEDVVSLGGISEERESEDEETLLEKVTTRDAENGNAIRDSGPEEAEGSCARVMKGHSKAVTALFFEENCLVTGASDKTLRQWDLTTGQCVLTMDILWALSHPPTSAAATATFGASAYGAASALGHFAVPTPPYQDGSWDMYQDFVGGVQFWGYALVSGSGDGAVRMWDMRTGQAHRTLLGHTGPVTCLQFDELHIVSGSLDKTIRIWDLRTAGLFETLKYDHGVTALQFDSRKIVAAAGENGVKVYNRTTMQYNSLTINGHTRPVERLRYMDRYMVTGAKDSTVKIWAL